MRFPEFLGVKKWQSGKESVILSRSFRLCSEMFLRDFKNVLFFFDIFFRSTNFLLGAVAEVSLKAG
jgi:hypothetical protein